MTESIKRKNPRRPYIMTAEGIRRIYLGQTGAGATNATAGSMPRATPDKPLRLQREPMRYVMAVTHSDRGMLEEPSRQAIAAAALIADEQTAVVAVILGDLTEDLAPLGADLVIDVPACDFRQYAPETEMACLAGLLDTYQPLHVLIPDNAMGDGDLGRRLAARRDASIATHVVELTRQDVAAYQDAGAQIGRRPLPDFILLDPDTVDPRLPFVGKGERRASDPPRRQDTRYRDLGLESIDASSVALEEADIIVSAGNGVKDVATLEALAKAMGAAVGASRVAVDDGKFPRDKQVGATGKTVKASAYLAIGISGAVQHLQGIKECKHVIAINLDESAPIIKRADLSVIDDAQAIMQQMLSDVQATNGKQMKEGA